MSTSTVATSPVFGSLSGQSSRSRSSTKLADDAPSLTSFNPFSEEDENDQSSYALVTSLFSKVKNTLSGPLTSSAPPATTPTIPNTSTPTPQPNPNNTRRPSYATMPTGISSMSNRTNGSDRPHPLVAAPVQAAPPLMSLTPAQPEMPSYTIEIDPAPSQRHPYSPALEQGENIPFGTSIPGFPIADDARSVITSASMQRSGSVSKIMRRLRGEGLSREYWMDDENCKECYDCKSVFTAWRRKHHCRICGQIFCSRCASNVLKGARFNSEGMIRVCNLCMEKLAKVDEDDEDDRRSVTSSVAFPAHQLGKNEHSPFAPSQIRAEDYNIFPVGEGRHPFYSPSLYPSRPDSPYLSEPNGIMIPQVRDTPAPFRRTLFEEDKDSPALGSSFQPEANPGSVGLPSRIQASTSIPISAEAGPSTIQFPSASPDRLDSPSSFSRSGVGTIPFPDFDAATPFIRSRVQSQMTTLQGEPGWRTRRESTAYANLLNDASMRQLKVMLHQMLVLEDIPNVAEWEDVLEKLALRIAREMTFTGLPNRQGQDMDVRRYVKIKKLPGGAPKDSEYVNGVVITKNVAHRQMSRDIDNPRVMLVTFPLEFSRVEGQYLHFKQILSQEREYLGNLASRITALFPHVVLVEKSVSRIVLDALANQNIVVARSVKPSAIQTVGRMTQGDIFSSMDKLALEPRLGHCARYRVQTFDHPLIPGRRKTFMRFEGCNRDMGCTIILRGGNLETLRRIKKVTRFLIFVVRNLKLESHLWKDLLLELKLPVGITEGEAPSTRAINSLPDPESTPKESAFVELPNEEDDLPNEDAEQLQLTKRIDASLEPYTRTFISISANLRFPAPYPIRRMKELDTLLIQAKRAWEDEVVRTEEKIQSKHQQESTITQASMDSMSSTTAGVEEGSFDDIVAQIQALPAPNIPSTPVLPEGTPAASLGDDGQSYFSLQSGSSSVAPTPGGSSIGSPGSFQYLPMEEPEPLKTAADIQLQSRYTFIKWQHEEHRRIWEWYLRKNMDDFVIEKYQCIFLREYIIPSNVAQPKPCFAPSLELVKFYGENDQTLAQFIEKTVTDTVANLLDPDQICGGKGCDKPLSQHSRVYIHNESKVTVTVDRFDGQIVIQPTYHRSSGLFTWSVCRLCSSSTPLIAVSLEMARYSFAKFLELHFYPTDVDLLQTAGCQHNIYRDHIRYFACRSMRVSVQADPVELQEVVFPPTRIRVCPETQVEIKNADFDRLHYRNMLWYNALIDDLRLISIEGATGDEEADSRLVAMTNGLISRARVERDDMTRLINQVYRDSAPTDTLALNRVHADRQDKIVAWQQDFDKLPKPRPAQTVSYRKPTRSSAFDSMRVRWRPDHWGLGDLNFPFDLESSEAESFNDRKKPSRNHDLTDSEAEPDPKPIESEKKELQELEKTSEAAVSQDEQQKSDPDSDSTIGVARDSTKDLPADAEPNLDATVEPETASPEAQPGTDEQSANEEDPALADVPTIDPAPQKASRLPRLAGQNSSVAELIKKYQDFIPAQSVQDLAQTAMAPPGLVSESEQEYPNAYSWKTLDRNKTKRRMPIKKQPSTSDFEQGYAANVAPRYPGTLANRRAGTPVTRRAASARIAEPQASPRRHSPEKPAFDLQHSRASSPNRLTTARRSAQARVVSRSKDKAPLRPTPATNPRGTYRRPPPPTGAKVSDIMKRYEKIGRDAERAKNKYSVIRKKARPVASAKPTVEILHSVKVAIGGDSESSDSSEADDEGDENEEEAPRPSPLPLPATTDEPVQEEPPAVPTVVEPEPDTQAIPLSTAAPTTSDTPSRELPPSHISLPPSPFLEPVKRDLEPIGPLTPPASDAEGSERPSILKALSNTLWPQTMRGSIEMDDPMNDPEHIFRDSSMVVRLDEPTSIIALALNSPQYRELLLKSRAEKRTVREVRLNEGTEAFMPDESIAESTSTWGVVNLGSTDSADPTEDLRVPSSKLPWAITFESGGLTISCTILYPEQFDALRRTYDCEKSMIESLARCVKWNASGGKSGSAFLKTRDDRFIAKELSRPELQTMETFAPAYFDYMSSAIYGNRPTLLAKVFGCYKLTFRKTGKDKGPGRAKSMQMNLLVMENLFYDRRFAKIYDLKGSTRNRHVQSTGRENEVLLDENLVETAHLNPFFLREHSKRILRGALYNDSKFLADINVMDYSLVCGVDAQSRELVIGIVDYIRTYTWDKKLESWVKESAFLGGGAKGEPTIVTPKQYRQRFLGAMERYFPLIPDRWMKQMDTPDEESAISSELWPDW